ncbi:ubiquitin carboxyl-terminal hydrolase 37-like isoform X1 [Oncorhynchus keta]|uniref:ubiquitin carboxyl-terminal hydrolase 37-like isoform X1 n=1 Tax=Oncorhynchus keta TaxID=8018 RepID=UPI00227BD12D|nr:ubiquitin carboxyl-terminal hydrolase 37-like isoform X1 [Oncorhynchus keta]XP_052383229.1 ubiquitin carboxyl-terminal hydrolase 37-like isoform X1 [Oncorhynchus keta]XP_052383230.1 ubiquitin carboxyl-terminal hydrolase 37-like isoform X1 [Oncorhynchus keta]XP_052383231.1 ubiquitin carboxyl-terminal hydrolase 37-like isoform X1 [Oncorhynchus keta]
MTHLSLGLEQKDLAHWFSIHQSTGRRIIISWANYFYCLLGSARIWIPRETIKAHLPPEFKDYPDTQKKRQKANSIDVEQKTRNKKESSTSSPSPIPTDRSERNSSATSDPSPSDQLSSLYPPPSPVNCSSQPCSPAKQPSLPRAPAKHPSQVKSSPVVSRPSSPSPTNPLDSHGDTSQEGATVRPLSLQDHSISRPQRSGSGARSQTLPRASSATRRSEETQGARGERGALVNMELLGLPNIGNTCFLNATLQCLLVLPSFSKEILRQEQLWSSSPFSNLLRCLSDVHRSGLPDSGANQASKADLMWKVKYSLSGYDLKYLGDTQQDAHELLVNMLCQLKEEGMILKTLGVNYTCPVSQLEFQLVSVRTCTSCGRESSTREDYNHLSLDFSSERTLLSSLALTFKREKVEFTCAGCKGLHASKVEQFHTLPLVLVLHLKRFGGPGGLEKLEAPLLFPSELRLSTFCGDTVPPLHSASPQALTNQTPNIQVSIPQTLDSQVSNPPGEAKDSALCCSDSNDQEPGKVLWTASVKQPVKSVNGYYQLTGVVSHLGGSANSGHYISDILNASGNWFCCNDSQVSMSNEATVLKTRAWSAYLLFYMFKYSRHLYSCVAIYVYCMYSKWFLSPFRAWEQEAPAHRA